MPRHRSSIALVTGSLLLASLPGLALAAQVKGRLTGAEKLLNPAWNEAKTSTHRFTWREPSPTVRSEFRNLSAFAPKEVCIAALAATPQPPPSLPMLVTVGGGRTTPVTLVVAPGTRIRFENRDPFPHKLYGVNQPTFVASAISLGGSREWTVPGPGKYEIRDEAAPSVRGFIVAEPNVAAIAYPARDGSFAFGALAAGDYTVQAYFSGAPTGPARPITVKGDLEIKDALTLVPDSDKAKDKGEAKK